MHQRAVDASVETLQPVSILGADVMRLICTMARATVLRMLCHVSHLWRKHAREELEQRRPAPGEYSTIHTSRSWDLGQERLNALQRLGHPVYETLKAQTQYILTIHEDHTHFTLKRNLVLDGVYRSSVRSIDKAGGVLPAGGGALRFMDGCALTEDRIELLPNDEDDHGAARTVKHLRVSEFVGHVGYATWKLRAPVVVADFEPERQQGVQVMQLHGPHEKLYG